MSTSTDCFICMKHRHLPEFTGEVITERGGLLLTHFPFLKDEVTTLGRLLIEPQRHISDFSELSAEEAAELGGLIRDGAASLKSVLGAEHVYLFRINDKVAHLHFHLVPRFPGTPREWWGFRILDWNGRQQLTLDEIVAVSNDLRGWFLRS